MTENERADWQKKMSWLPAEQAAQWTEKTREAWLTMRKAHKAYMVARVPPSLVYGSLKENGKLAPLWIPNDEYVKYQAAWLQYQAVMPEYISGKRARLSAGDFEEDDE